MFPHMRIWLCMEMTVERPEALFSLLGERARLRLACCLLAEPGGLCVCEMAEALRISQPNLSQHLRLMKAGGLAEERREGRWVYYRLPHPGHPLLKHIRICLDMVCCCSDVQEDLKRLRARLKLRRGGRCVVGFSREKTKRRASV